MANGEILIEGRCYPNLDFSIRVPFGTKRLNLSNKMLMDLDFDAIGSLRSLEELDLSGNYFHDVNVDLRKVEACPLRSIKLYGDITLASAEPCVYNLTLGKFPALEFLELRDNALTRLDLAPLAWSEKLRTLDISWNHLVDLETSPLGNCSDLQKLNLETNQLREVSGEVCQLHNLEVLKLSYNKLAFLPEHLGSLENLKRLELSSNPLDKIPDSFSSLEKLEALKIASIPLCSIPKTLPNLAWLLVLDARSLVCEKSNQPVLTKIIDALYNVAYVDIGMNKLKEVPGRLCECTDLKYLDLGFNEIEFLPGWFDALPQLEVLGLDNYKGRAFPDVVLGLQHLKHITMTGVTCPFPEALLELPCLERMAVSRERMADPTIKRLIDKGISVYGSFLGHDRFRQSYGALPELDNL